MKYSQILKNGDYMIQKLPHCLAHLFLTRCVRNIIIIIAVKMKSMMSLIFHILFLKITMRKSLFLKNNTKNTKVIVVASIMQKRNKKVSPY
jgi:hypothetical protein